MSSTRLLGAWPCVHACECVRELQAFNAIKCVSVSAAECFPHRLRSSVEEQAL